MNDRAARLLPLKPADFHILMVLLDGTMHGYGLMKAVDEQSHGSVRLEVGSLYRLIGRMIDDGLLQVSPPPAGSRDDRRKYYRLTPLGETTARAEAQRLAAVLETARAKRLLGES